MKDKIPRGVTTIAKRPQKLFRGKLAEVYDGIGLYCVVAVSDGSTSGVYRARVGAGDFAGGRVFPVGTDVITFVHDGKLEVLTLGNLPGCKCLEDFNQEYTSGWGAGGWDLVWDFYGEGSVGLQRESAFYTQDGKGIIELLDDTSPNDRYIAVRAAFEYPITLLSKVTVVTPNDEPFGWLTLRMYFTQSTAILTSGICQQYVQIASGNADDKIDLDPGVTTWDASWTQISYVVAPDVLIGFTGKPFYWKVYADGRMIMHKVWFVGDEEPAEYQSWEIRGDSPLMPGPYYIGLYSVYTNGTGDLSAWRLEFESICSTDEEVPVILPSVQSASSGPGDGMSPGAQLQYPVTSGSLLVYASIKNSAGAGGAPDNTGVWTQLLSPFDLGDGRVGEVYWKIADGTEGTDFYNGVAGASAWGLFVAEFDTTDRAVTLDTFTESTLTYGSPYTCSGTITPGPDSRILVGLLVAENQNTPAIGPFSNLSSGWTWLEERYAQNNSAPGTGNPRAIFVCRLFGSPQTGAFPVSANFQPGYSEWNFKKVIIASFDVKDK